MYIIIKNKHLGNFSKPYIIAEIGSNFNQSFQINLVKIVIASILMGFLFQFLLNSFEDQLAFDQKIKSLYLILSAFLGLSFYLLICYFIKAFKLSDIKLKY